MWLTKRNPKKYLLLAHPTGSTIPIGTHNWEVGMVSKLQEIIHVSNNLLSTSISDIAHLINTGSAGLEVGRRVRASPLRASNLGIASTKDC